MEKKIEQIAIKTSRNTIFGNVFLFLFKLVAGILGNSAAMVSDAVHSLSDVISTIIVIVGVKFASKKADKEHMYGHERFECVAALVLAVVLLATGAGIGYGGIKTIVKGEYSEKSIPGIVALVAAVVSIIIKEGMYWYTRAAAKRINSSALMADAWHHRSDALSSVGSFAGILGARIGFPILDSVACLLICLLIVKVAFDILLDSIGKMTDRACDEKLLCEIREVILNQESVYKVDFLRTRMFANKIFVDVEITADRNLPLFQSHEIAHAVHDAIEEQFKNVKHCMVHVNPSEV